MPPKRKTIEEASDGQSPKDEQMNSNKGRQYWLMKAEPESRIVKGKDVKFSIDDLKELGSSPWDGVRNYEARNIMRNKMRLGDLILFYHSNCSKPGIAGIAEVSREGYVDFTAFDSSHPYYDEKSDKDSPRWYMVDVKFIRKLERFICLNELKRYKDSELSDMILLHRGRLSVQPVSEKEFNFVVDLAKKNPQ